MYVLVGGEEEGQGRLKGEGAPQWYCTETPLSTDPGVTAPRGGAESLPRRVGVSHPGSAGAARVPHRRVSRPHQGSPAPHQWAGASG